MLPRLGFCGNGIPANLTERQANRHNVTSSCHDCPELKTALNTAGESTFLPRLAATSALFGTLLTGIRIIMSGI